jgi:hypothetical protein
MTEEGVDALLAFMDRLSFALPNFFSALKSHFRKSLLVS